MSSGETLTVAQAGTTGPVATLFRHYLRDPRLQMELGDVATAREENVGKALGEVDKTCPPQWTEKELISLGQLAQSNAAVIFSSLRPPQGGEYEGELAQGRLVVTNAPDNRTRADVPLVNTFINGSHLDELFQLDLPGRIAAGGNCMVNIEIGVLAPIDRAIGVEKVIQVETLQGWSGAGKLIIPHGEEGAITPIKGDEAEKIKTEPNKFLGRSMHEPANIITEHVDPNRAPWVYGHHAKITAKLARETSVAEVQEILRSFRAPTEIEEIKKELQALGQITHKRWPHRHEQWPKKHEPIRPVKLAYKSPVRWDLQPIKLGEVYPMRVIGYVQKVDEDDPNVVVLEAAGDNLGIGAVGNNILNILYARLKGYI